jgi:prolyl-tRNA editing enzyme YbaK/EbsC (Cys-tRNA(Pro) deacylase)
MKGALDLHRDLLARDVPHEIVRLPRIMLAAAELPEILGLPPSSCLATRLYEVDDRLVAVMTTVDTHPHPQAILAAADGRTLRPASVERVNSVTEFVFGLVPPLPLPAEVPLFADARCGLPEVVYTPTGEAGTALGIRAVDLLRVAGALMGDFATAPAMAEAELSADTLEAG